jgi:hypothetical protein
MYCLSPLCLKGLKGSTEHLGPLSKNPGPVLNWYLLQQKSVSLNHSTVIQGKQILCTSVRSYGTNSVRRGCTFFDNSDTDSHKFFEQMHHTKKHSKSDCCWQQKHVAGMSEIKRCTTGGCASAIWCTTTCYRNVGNKLPSDACHNKWKNQV